MGSGGSKFLSTPWNPLATSWQFAGSLFRCIWFLLVWAIFATAIVRYVALRLVDEEQPSFRDTLRFGTQKWPAAFNSAAFVFLGIVALAIPGGLLGLLIQKPQLPYLALVGLSCKHT